MRHRRPAADNSRGRLRACQAPRHDREAVMNIGAIVLIAFAVLLLTPFPRLILAALFGQKIARAALAKQPDTIHLVAIEPAAFRRAERVRALVSEYLGN